jgi:RNA polymerase sigma factor (sigma-70 family)
MTDKELLQGCRKNHSPAQTLLYDRYKGRMMGICRRYAGNTTDAEDILQEAFIKIFRNINQIREEKALVGWMKKIVTHTAINYYRANLKYNQNTEYEELVLTDDSYTDLLSKLATEEIFKLINELPTGYRLVFNLYLIDGYEHKEIAGMLHISEGTSRSQLSKAKALLREKLIQIEAILYARHT